MTRWFALGVMLGYDASLITRYAPSWLATLTFSLVIATGAYAVWACVRNLCKGEGGRDRS